MDNYQNLLNALDNAIEKVKAEIDAEELKFTEKEKEINEIEHQHSIFKTNCVSKKYYLEVLNDFKGVTKLQRWWFILTLLCRSVVIGVVGAFAWAIINMPVLSSVLIAFVELIAIAFSTIEYLGEISEERHIRKTHKKENLEVHIEELEHNLKLTETKKEALTKEGESIEAIIKILNEKLNILINRKERIVNQRNLAIEKLVLANEDTLNKYYTNDKEVEKLERVLNNGKNI